MLLLFDSIKLFNKLALVTPVPYRTGIWLFVHDWFYGSVKVGPPVHNYEHEAGSYGDGFT